MTAARRFFIARVYGDGRVAMEFTEEGSEGEVRERILVDARYAPGTYLLLEKNALVVEKVST